MTNGGGGGGGVVVDKARLKPHDLTSHSCTLPLPSTSCSYQQSDDSIPPEVETLWFLGMQIALLWAKMHFNWNRIGFLFRWTSGEEKGKDDAMPRHFITSSERCKDDAKAEMQYFLTGGERSFLIKRQPLCWIWGIFSMNQFYFWKIDNYDWE